MSRRLFPHNLIGFDDTSMSMQKEERELKGPCSYERYNKISIFCQQKYFRLIKFQIYLLLSIALVSLLPSSSEARIENFKRVIELILIIIVLYIMILQYNQNYIKGWQNARYLAESILNNAWLFVWKYEPFNDKNSTENFLNMIENLEKEFDLKTFLSLFPCQEDEISDWMTEFRDQDTDVKRNNYMKYRIDDQIKWYSNKAVFNEKQGTQWFRAGLLLMIIGAFLTIFIIIDILPNVSFLGFFTTAAATVFSWSLAKRNDELKITYAVNAQELSRMKSRIKLSNENDLINIVLNIENAISREHKLWAAKIT